MRQWEMRLVLWLAVVTAVLVVSLLVGAVVAVGRTSVSAEQRSDRIVDQVLQEIRSPSDGTERRELFDRLERIERLLEDR